MLSFTENQFSFKSCLSKVSYVNEESARAAGRQASSERSVELWIYECALCNGWHLTKQPRERNWNVNNENYALDVYADVSGDKLFWARLFEMPFVEANHSLRAAKRLAMERFGNCGSDMERSGRLGGFLRRISDELHFLQQNQENQRFKKAVLAVYGKEGWDNVLKELARQEAILHDKLHEMI